MTLILSLWQYYTRYVAPKNNTNVCVPGFSTSEMLKKQPMTQSASVKVFLCVFSVIMCIQSINGHFHHHAPVWKPPKDKAFPICGEDLRDRARCKAYWYHSQQQKLWCYHPKLYHDTSEKSMASSARSPDVTYKKL
ncbi:uncharacterized protein [Dermacentor andersoni]|uniref:uncharacterized protein isoform X3 n=1 Tax=Dermacentor andersoni TaxID=34620 RepID=UPI003B3BAFFD